MVVDEDLITKVSDCLFTSINSADFILDIGATRYIIADRRYFIESSFIQHQSRVSWGNAVNLTLISYGNCGVIFLDSNTRAILTNCLFLPKIGLNIIAGSALNKKGYSCYIANRKAKIIDRGNN